ncbi:MAG TPA: hypothetical protein VK802_04165 [Streptosporangiaceae bacterium]|jgi:hypothetical protein|nr:hypothetical protein [Streptosporangiaceae bacterium]
MSSKTRRISLAAVARYSALTAGRSAGTVARPPDGSAATTALASAAPDGAVYGFPRRSPSVRSFTRDADASSSTWM